jgi:hypothetical protein
MRGCVEIKDLRSLVPPTTNTLRRGRPKKNKESGETLVPSKSRARSTVEELLMRAIRMEPVEGTSRERWNKMRRTNIEGAYVQESSR